MFTKCGTLKICLAITTFVVTSVVGCGNIGELEPTAEENKNPIAQHSNNAIGNTENGRSCIVDGVRYPTNEEDFQHLLYGNRGFLSVYQNIKHLGRDIIYTEGTAIRAITCGEIVFYSSANGYGTLAVVIEIKLPYPMSFMNGDGEYVTTDTVLAIYGHQRKTEYADGGNMLTWKVGDIVQMGEIISFVQNDDLNGDGTPHLHLGIRLQSAAEAQASDSGYWFRGYDSAGEGKYKKYFTDPEQFILTLQEQLQGGGGGAQSTITHLPLGTLVKTDAGRYELVSDDGLFDVSNVKYLPFECAVNVAQDFLSCYQQMPSDTISLTLDGQVVKFDGEPQVYMLYPSQGSTLIGFHAFLSYESFLSWGYAPKDIVNYPFEQKSAVIGSLLNLGDLGMRPGTLVKGMGESEVSVANQNGERRSIFNWDVFTAMGYKSSCVYEVEPSTLDAVAGKRSENVINTAELGQCNTPQPVSCTPGSWVDCDCGSGVSGSKTCNSDGASFGTCECPTNGNGGGLGSDEDAGTDTDANSSTGGSSGSGGSTGIGGNDESGGSSGSTGTGGAGGTSVDAGPAYYCFDPYARACTTNETRLVSCPGGTAIVQTCLADCSGWTDEACPDAGVEDSGNVSNICQAHGIPGKVTVSIVAPVGQTNSLCVAGWVDNPGWSGVPDEAWSHWAWADAGVGELVFQKGEAYQGTKYIFAPGVCSSYGQPQGAWYCDQVGCPIGTFVVCNGLQEACRVQNGQLSGGASYTPNSANWQNIMCTLS